MTPICFPSSPTSRTSGTRIRSLIRVWSRSGGRRSNLRGTGTSCGGGVTSSGAGPCVVKQLGSTAAEYSGGSSGWRDFSTSDSSRCDESRNGHPIPRRRGGARARRPRRAPARGRRRPACTGSCAARRHGSCAPTDSVALVDLGPQTGRADPLRRRLRRVVDMTVGDREHDRLTGASQSGSSPPRCSSRIPMKRSIRAHQRPVDHHRLVLGVVRAGVGQLEALGEVVVELNGPELPRAAERVGHVHVDLRAVEGAVALVEVVLETLALERAAGALPRLWSHSSSEPIRLRRARRELEPRRRARTRRRSRTRTRGSRATSSWICSSVQKMWASSWAKWRTRSRPCSVPLGSRRCSSPGSQ